MVDPRRRSGPGGPPAKPFSFFPRGRSNALITPPPLLSARPKAAQSPLAASNKKEDIFQNGVRAPSTKRRDAHPRRSDPQTFNLVLANFFLKT